MSSSEIRPEERPIETLVPPLDPALLQLLPDEIAFLHSAITSDDEERRRRLLDVQKRSYEQYPYPCIRAFHFVFLFMRQNDIYQKVVDAGKQGDTFFLDLGCCMGTDVRKLVLDGYPATNVIGCDLRQEFIDIGHELFQDKHTCAIHFFAADIFDVPTSPAAATGVNVPLSDTSTLAQLRGKLTHVYTGALFHLFDEITQYAIASRVALLLKRTAGAVVFGRHQGLREEGMIADHMSRVRYGHSPESWVRLWKRVFSEIEGTEFADNRVVVEATLKGHLANVNSKGGEALMLYWSPRPLPPEYSGGTIEPFMGFNQLKRHA